MNDLRLEENTITKPGIRMEPTERLYRVALDCKEIGQYPMADLREFWQSGGLDRTAHYFHEAIRQCGFGTVTYKVDLKQQNSLVQAARWGPPITAGR